MLEEAERFMRAISGRIRRMCREETSNALRVTRYDVTTAPNGTVIGVTQPYSDTELFLPYSSAVSTAQVGDSVLVVWWGSLSTAKVWYFGGGPT